MSAGAPPPVDGAQGAHAAHDGAPPAAHEEHTPHTAHLHTKKITSLNINQRFLQQAAGGAPAGAGAAKAAARAPEAAPGGGPWGRGSPAAAPAATASHAAGAQDAAGETGAGAPGGKYHSPRLVTAMPNRAHSPQQAPAESGKAPGAAAAAPGAAETHAPAPTQRTPWGRVQQTPPSAAARPVSSQDFPTAAEVMAAQREAEERAAAAAAEEAAKHQASLHELDRFRGTDLHTKEHWDEMDEDDEESLDDVVEFGDGTQYKISDVEQEQAAARARAAQQQQARRQPAQPARAAAPAPAPAPREERAAPRAPWANFRPAVRAEPLPRHHFTDAPPRHFADAPPALHGRMPPPSESRGPALDSWGPMARRHTMLTGKPAEPPAPAPAPAEPPADLGSSQHDEMLTAAERARKRREEDERQREAERQRARQRALQIEEQLKAAERAKREERERARAQQEAERARARAQPEAERQRHSVPDDAVSWRSNRPAARDEPSRRERKAAERRERAERERADRERAVAEREDELAQRERAAAAARPADAPPPEPVQTAEPFELEPAPVWRQFPVLLARRSARARRAPSQAWSHALVLRHEEPVSTRAEPELLAPRRQRATVRLPTGAHRRRAAPLPAEADEPLRDEAPLLAALLGDVDVEERTAALFGEEPQVVQVRLPARPLARAAPAPRVKLPGGALRRAASLAAPSSAFADTAGATGLFARPLGAEAPARRADAPGFARAFGERARAAGKGAGVPPRPLFGGAASGPGAAPGGGSTWGSMALPLLEPRGAGDAGQDHLKSVWSSQPDGQQPSAASKNSLMGIADDVLPSHIPLSVHDLHEPPGGTPPSKLDVFASPFEPSGLQGGGNGASGAEAGTPPANEQGAPPGGAFPPRTQLPGQGAMPRAPRYPVSGAPSGMFGDRRAPSSGSGDERYGRGDERYGRGDERYGYMVPAAYSDFVLPDSW